MLCTSKRSALCRSKRLALPREVEIIPHLPDDIARKCLLRVPYKWHSTLKLVCRKWNEIVSDPKFYKDRMTTGTTEQLICTIQVGLRGIVVLDPVTLTWDILRQNPDFPIFIRSVPMFDECVCVKGKLVIFGGIFIEKAVYIFDFASAKWRRGTDMPTKRYRFACAVSSSTGLIYVAGGKYGETVLSTAEVYIYNVEEDRREILPPMTQQRFGCQGFFLREKFFVFRGEDGNNAEFFDPKTGVWTRVDNMWRFERSFKLSCIVASGHLYTSTENQLMKYNAEENDWVIQSVLPAQFPEISSTAEWRGHIFVCKPSSDFLCPRQFCHLLNPLTKESIEFDFLCPRQFCYLLNPWTNESIEFEVPENFVGETMHAATVEI